MVFDALFNEFSLKTITFVPNGIDLVKRAKQVDDQKRNQLIHLLYLLQCLDNHYYIVIDDCHKLFEFKNSAMALDMKTALKSILYSNNLSKIAFMFISSLPMMFIKSLDFIPEASQIYLSYDHVTLEQWQTYFTELANKANIPEKEALILFNRYPCITFSPAVYAYIVLQWNNTPRFNETAEEFSQRVLDRAYDQMYRNITRGTALP